jgi:flagellar motor switch protein FliG
MADGIRFAEGTGVRKAAILLISLEQEAAIKVLSQMEKEDIERLSLEIAKFENEPVPREERDKVLSEFYHLSLAQQYTEQGGPQYARMLLEKVLAPEEARRVYETIEASMKSAPFGFLQKAESENILTFIQDEHPQTIALILAYIAPSQAAAVLEGLPPKKQLEVVNRLATMEHTSPDVTLQVEKALEAKFQTFFGQELKEAGGVETVAGVLNLAGRSTERAILEGLEEQDPELAEQIRRLMFVFDDIMRVNDRGVQNLLKQVEQQQLALALRTSKAELKEKFFRNMSQRAAEMLKEEMEFMGPVRVADVEAAQQAIVDIVRRLEEQGELFIEGRGGGEEMVV